MRALALACVLLAGCAGESVEKTSTTAAPEVGPATPTWEVGMWWNYTRTVGQGGFTLAVSGMVGGDYVVDTDDRNTAFFNALSDISYLGRIRAADLAGSQGTDAVAFLKFPLTVGESWSTTWDQETAIITVLSAAGETYHLEARRANGTLHATYAYGTHAQWFSEMSFFDAAGNAQFAFRLSSYGSKFPGMLHRWEVTPLAEWSGNLGADSFAGSVSVPALGTDVLWRWRAQCSSGAFSMAAARVAPPDSNPVRREMPCPTQDTLDVARPLSGSAESWSVHVVAPATSTGTYSLEALHRILTSFNAGAAP